MAKNWTMAEAVVAIANNDGEAILDIGKRYPLLANYVAKAVAGDGKAVVALFESIPEYLTANKVQTALKNALGEVSEAEDDEEVVEEKPAKPAKKAEKLEKKPAKKVVEEDEDEDETDEEAAADDYEAINGSKLYEMCKERGILSKCKTKKKADLIVALREDDANGGSTADSDDEDEAEETEAGKYDDMSAQELFKECKKRGIKAELKKPVKYYIDLLEADDNRDEADEEEDWEEEDEAPAPKKPAKKEEKKAAPKKEEKKPAKKAAKVEEDDDEDDDWDI